MSEYSATQLLLVAFGKLRMGVLLCTLSGNVDLVRTLRSAGVVEESEKQSSHEPAILLFLDDSIIAYDWLNITEGPEYAHFQGLFNTAMVERSRKCLLEYSIYKYIVQIHIYFMVLAICLTSVPQIIYRFLWSIIQDATYQKIPFCITNPSTVF